MGAIAQMVSSVCFLVLIVAIFGDLQELAEFFQSLWGGKVRELKAENQRLRRKLEKRDGQ